MLSLGLPDPPRRIYKRNPLRGVISQIRFPAIFALDEPIGVAQLQNEIRTDYPRTGNRAPQLSVVVGPGGLETSDRSRGPWIFSSEDHQWQVSVASDFIALETTSYERYEEFERRFEVLLTTAAEVLTLTHRTRVGLRYINQFQHPEASVASDWRRFLKSELLGAVGGELLRDHVRQALQQIELDLDPGGVKMAIRHGYVKNDEDTSAYLLDLDVFTEEEGPFEVPGILGLLREFKKASWTVFAESITKELSDYLEPEEA